MDMLLTSSGPAEAMQELIWRRLGKEPENARVLLIPSAAVGNDIAREGIAQCALGLMAMGIRWENVTMYHLHCLPSRGSLDTAAPRELRLMSSEELTEFDIAVVPGGNAGMLAAELERTGLKAELSQAVRDGLFYLGISAGSMAAAANFPGCMGLFQRPVIPHANQASALEDAGWSNGPEPVLIPDGSALWVHNGSWELI